MRCLALAQAWQDSGGGAIFAMAETTPSFDRRLQEEGIEVESVAASAGTANDAERTKEIAVRKNADWIVVDGYQFGSRYQLDIKESGFKLLFMDDHVHASPYSADLVLNQNMHARRSLYEGRENEQREHGTQLLLGPRYAMLRREFRRWRDWRREIAPRGRKVLVTMGGSDPDNLTARVIEAIRKISDATLEIVVLVGGSNPHLCALQEMIGEPKSGIRMIVDSSEVSEWMTWADVAVAAAGTTFWEICFLGLPSVLVALAVNQESVAENAERMGIAHNLGKQNGVSAVVIAENLAALLSSESERIKQSSNGRKLVDGRGSERVVAFLSGLRLRRTLEADCEIFWEWANEPQARAASFRSEPISWEEHAKWFRARLADPQAILYTAMRNEVRVGEVRYQIEGERAGLSISLGADFRGRGLGQQILTLATEKLFQDSQIHFIDAYVKPANEPSLKLFAGAGFQRLPAEVIEGQETVYFVLERTIVA